MIVVVAIAALVFVMLLMASIVLASLRTSERHLRSLSHDVEWVQHQLRTPAEREELQRRVEEIEAQKRVLFGLYENAGG
ncbi:MAG: hypothetical protein AAGA93_08345 [Actinomycetota bacterium]